MNTIICGVEFVKVNDGEIAIYQDGVLHKNILYPARTEQEFLNSANFYYIYCW